MIKNKRRNFLKGTLALSVLPFLPGTSMAGEKNELININAGSKILFQGDSITDGGRSRNNDWNHVMGHGYAYLVASKLGFEYPEKEYHFLNRGISGNKVTDLSSRWTEDVLTIKPDVLSILIGVNDVSAEINGKDGFSAAAYEEDFRKLLNLTRQELPKTKLVIGEPFILPGGRVQEKWTLWNEKIKERQHLAKMLAGEFNAVFVPFQTAFNQAIKKAPAAYWIWDGVHPMPAGHELMAREWMKAVGLTAL